MSNHSDTAANPSNSASGKRETNESLERKSEERAEAVGFEAEDTETDLDTLTKADE